MTNLTNLTDEGLRQQSSDLISEICELTREDAFVIPYDERIAMIASALQQIRDAAKKEERERCAKVAEKQEKGFWLGHKVLPDVATLTIIATAIRQME